MKKILIIILITITLITTTGCIKRDKMEDIDVITTIYPIEYVMNRLYRENSNITSIYPRGIKINNYEFTNKQIEDFSKKDLFIYNGESDERQYATTMLNMNQNLKIIDASYGIDATYSTTDIWLNPSNILMIAQNIRNELKEYITNPYLIEEINSKYELLKVDISELDTEYKKTADNSKNKTIISYNESLKFLEKYGFTVVNLTENNEEKENNIALAKKLLKNKEVSYIFITDDISNNIITNLKNNYSVETLIFNTAEIITENDIENSEDYLSIMHNNIELLKKETYS